MKIIAFILSVYILTLNFTPCEDEVSFDNDIHIELTNIVDIDHGHGDVDFCSPFCQCHCCHSHVTYFNMTSTVTSSNFISSNIFLYSDGIQKDFISTILQPPRV